VRRFGSSLVAKIISSLGEGATIEVLLPLAPPNEGTSHGPAQWFVRMARANGACRKCGMEARKAAAAANFDLLLNMFPEARRGGGPGRIGGRSRDFCNRDFRSVLWRSANWPCGRQAM
jgi:hypothetical protein